MNLSVHRFLLPKAGLESHECEDSIGIGSEAWRFCVADGATEGFGSRRWSKLLTKYWVKNTGLLDVEDFREFVVKLADRFDRYWQKKTLPWYAEEKARRGAFAAFAGLQFLQSTDGLQWRSIAQGDCCVFQVRNKEIIRASPLGDAEQFNNNPILISSGAARYSDQEGELILCDGVVESGDRFLLMSDAIAAWFLNTIHSDRETIASFYQALAQDDETGFTELVALERAEKRLKNDDVAVVQISITGLDE